VASESSRCLLFSPLEKGIKVTGSLFARQRRMDSLASLKWNKPFLHFLSEESVLPSFLSDQGAIGDLFLFFLFLTQR